MQDARCRHLSIHLIVTVRLAGQGGLRSVVAESVLVKHQLRIFNSGRKRASNLRVADRIIAAIDDRVVDRLVRFRLQDADSVVVYWFGVKWRSSALR